MPKTLVESLDHIESIVGVRPNKVYCDNGYRSHKEEKASVFISGQKRGVYSRIKKELRRRSAIEPIIGHLKQDHKMDRHHLNATWAIISLQLLQL